MPHTRQTITHFLIEEQRRSGASGAFTALLNDIVTACKMISSQVNRGGLAGAVQAGFMGVASRLTTPLALVANSASWVLLTASSPAGKSDGGTPVSRSAVRFAAMSAVGAAVLLVGLSMLPSSLIVSLLGDSFTDAVPAIRLVILAMAINSFRQPLAALLQRAGLQRFVAGTVILGTGVSLGLVVVLAPTHGATGGGVGLIVGQSTALIALVARCTGQGWVKDLRVKQS